MSPHPVTLAKLVLFLAGCSADSPSQTPRVSGPTTSGAPQPSQPAAPAGSPTPPSEQSATSTNVIPADATLNLDDRLEQHLEGFYGAGGWGIADNDPDALVPYVSIHAKDDHFVYITRGGLNQKFPHEFILRVRDEQARSNRPTIEVAPMWPVHLLREIVATERRVGKVFAPRDLLGNITLPGVELPQRNVVFLLDPVVTGLKAPSAYVAFVTAVLFNDADKAAMDQIPLGSTNIILKSRMEAEPLGLVPPGY